MATVVRPPLLQRIKRIAKVARHPPQYLKACLLVSIGGLLNGLDTSTIGPVISMPTFQSSFGPFSASLEGLIVSSILLPGIAFSFLGGSIADALGRARAIAIGTLLFSLGAGLEAGAVSLPMFLCGRLTVGVGQGIFLSVCIVYVCEVAPPKERGPLTTVIQLLITLGLVLGFFTSYGTVGIPSSLSWRLPLMLQSGIAFALACAAHFYLPPSPRWLTSKGRRIEAAQAWDRLGVSSAEREKDEAGDEFDAVAADATEDAANRSLRERVRQNLRALAAVFGPAARKQMFLGVFMMAMQQLSGIDGVIYYAPLLFKQAGLSSSEASFLASGVSAILIFTFTIVAVYMVDRWGRRASTIGGGLLMLSCMLTMGICYATDSVHPDRGVGKWVVIVTIYIFSIVYSMTWAVGLKLFASEIQPTRTRATASSLAQGANFVTNFFVAFITPVLLDKSSSAVYFLFGVFLALTLAVGLVYMPETKGRDLEEVQRAFGLHKIGDTPIVKAFKTIVSKITRKVNASPAISIHSNGTEEVELQDVGDLLNRA